MTYCVLCTVMAKKENKNIEQRIFPSFITIYLYWLWIVSDKNNLGRIMMITVMAVRLKWDFPAYCTYSSCSVIHFRCFHTFVAKRAWFGIFCKIDTQNRFSCIAASCPFGSKMSLRSNYWYSFFSISVYNMTFLHILPNFNPLRTLEVILFLLLFPRIYGRHYLTLFQGLVAN